MQILQTSDVFGGTYDDPEFLHAAIVYRKNQNIFLAYVPDMMSKNEEINIDKLKGGLIAPDRVFPPFDPAAFTLCPDPTASDIYIKRPSLVAYNHLGEKDVTIRETVLQEALVCEALLKKFRHGNVAEYLGCEVENARITGLCFRKYEKTLFESVYEANAPLDHRSCIEGIRSGIEHLHCHGYCHNDMNPANIMLDVNATPIIIDFDSCRPEGAEFGHKAGTEGWNCQTSEKSQRENDINGLNQIKNFLEAHPAKQ